MTLSPSSAMPRIPSGAPARPPAQGAIPSAARETPSRAEPSRPRPRDERFERLLRRQAGDDREPADGRDGASASLLPKAEPPAPANAPAVRAGGIAPLGHAGPAARGGVDAPSETLARAGREAALSGAPASALGPACGGAAQAFEVTLGNGRGPDLTMRAERAGAAASATTPPWTLTLGAGVLDASLLARHVARLNERLQARPSTCAHARIDDRPGRQRDGRGEGQT
jgi:hypothetical protein